MVGEQIKILHQDTGEDSTFEIYLTGGASRNEHILHQLQDNLGRVIIPLKRYEVRIVH